MFIRGLVNRSVSIIPLCRDTMTRTFCPDHENIIDISPPCVRLPRGVSESVGFEHTKKKVSKRRSRFSTHRSTMDLKIMLLVKCEIRIMRKRSHSVSLGMCLSGRISRK